jgi:tetraacyldisaccharide-1-P 4'-kinase
MRGKSVIAAAAVADPDSFAWQCRAMGAEVKLISWRDHHAFTERDVGLLADAGRSADYVVVTEKDAVKLRGHWRDHRAEPLVADLEVRWEAGGTDVMAALERLYPVAA